MNCLNFSAYYDDYHDIEDFDDHNGGEPSSECHHNNYIEDPFSDCKRLCSAAKLYFPKVIEIVYLGLLSP